MLNHCLKEIIESVSYNDSNVGKKLRHVLIAKFSEKMENLLSQLL